jgi:cytokinin riboside 5'-monophosphate phosphoribohydrolase
MKDKICVFCSSSEDLDQKYYGVAAELGKIIALENYDLIHGAGTIGLMGVLMKSAATNGSKVIGVVPERLNRENIVSDLHQELVITVDMKDRKEYMRKNANAFITLPGGFGTLEEILEVITLKQLKYHNKAIVIVNSYGYFDHLLRQFDYMFDTGFAIEAYKNLYYIAQSPEDAINYIKNYTPEHIYDKYLRE